MVVNIFCRFRFEAFHRWPSAPAEHAYLGVLHRHIFHVELVRPVEHSDRDVEFIDWKRKCEALVDEQKTRKETEGWSCEHWATWMIDACSADMATVSEDGENGAIVHRSQ